MERALREKIEGVEAGPVRDVGQEQPFYDRIPRGKLKADPRAIANLDALPRPKAPPGRAPSASVTELGDVTAVPPVDTERLHTFIDGLAWDGVERLVAS